MRLELGEDASALCSGIADFGRARVQSNAAAWDLAEALPTGLPAELGEQGLLGLSVAEAIGGTELGQGDALAVVETLAAFDASLALLVMAHNLLALDAIPAGLRDESMTSGARLLGYADLDDAGASVTAAPGDAGFVLRGSKRRALLATTASDWVVEADIEGGDRACFLVPRDAEGVAATGQATLGFAAGDLGALSLDGVSLPKTAHLGPVNAPRRAAAFALGLGAIANGISTAALLEATAYAKERVQFGKPIANFQAIQWKLANLATGRDAARLMVGVAASLEPGAGQHGRASAAAVKACNIAVGGCSEALQIHGGYGYTKEFAVERHLRDARACTALLGGAASRGPVADAIRARFS